jgi:hypothetical protein
MEPTGPRKARPDEQAPRNAGRSSMWHQPRIRHSASKTRVNALMAPSGLHLHHVKQRSLLHSRCILASGFFSFLFAFVAADPPSEGIGGAPRGGQPCTCRAVTRDATLARHWPSRATGRPASRRSAVALSAQVPPPSPLPGPRHQPLWTGCGAGLFVSAVTSRGRRHIPLRLQDRLAKAPLVSGMFTFYPKL